MYNISFLGASGAGKGTQAAAVAWRLNLEHIATGDLFRQAVERGDGKLEEGVADDDRGGLGAAEAPPPG